MSSWLEEVEEELRTMDEGGSSNGNPSPSTAIVARDVNFISRILHTEMENLPFMYPQVIDGLKQIYKTKVLPVEERYKFEQFNSASLRDCDFDARPMVLLLGQYSVGKTSFIEYMLGRKFPNQRIGPEPTTDRFGAVMYGEEDRVIPGNALSVDAEKPFHGLNRFGTGFLSKFEACECNSPILKHVTFIDTPGVLSGEKQRIGRSYDFTGVVEWFAERADIILLLFDCSKLDISDEFKRTIEMLKGHDDKIRVVLNKADTVTAQHLMRVYGAMMWSLGKVVKTPEVMRVYIGSFWTREYQNKTNASLFEAEQRDLIEDLKALPKNASVRKVNELVKRARQVKVHSIIIAQLKKKMPGMWGKQKKQRSLIENMANEFKEIKRMYKLPPGDFPDIERFKQQLMDYDFGKFPKMDPRLVQGIDEVLGTELPKLMQQVSPPSAEAENNPFSEEAITWDCPPKMTAKFEKDFSKLPHDNGKVSGVNCKKVLLSTGVRKDLLKQIWTLSDIDKDGCLDKPEFCLAMWLCFKVKKGQSLPSVLPDRMIPPSKRDIASK